MSFDKKNTYEDLKRENEKMKEKLNALGGMMAKHKGKAYIAEGGIWDDTESDEDVEYGNLALMADSTDETPVSTQVTPILTTIDMPLSAYKETVEELSVEMFNIHTSMLAAEKENTRLNLLIKALTAKNEELGLVTLSIENLKDRNAYLENRVKCDELIEASLTAKNDELELKLQAYANAANIAHTFNDPQRLEKMTCIGFDYSKFGKDKGKDKRTLFKSGGFEDSPSIPVNVPHIIKDSPEPIFKSAEPAPLDHDRIFIQEQLRVEDEVKNEENQEQEKVLPSKSVKIESAKTEPGKKNKMRTNKNGKVGINQ